MPFSLINAKKVKCEKIRCGKGSLRIRKNKHGRRTLRCDPASSDDEINDDREIECLSEASDNDLPSPKAKVKRCFRVSSCDECYKWGGNVGPTDLNIMDQMIYHDNENGMIYICKENAFGDNISKYFDSIPDTGFLKVVSVRNPKQLPATFAYKSKCTTLDGFISLEQDGDPWVGDATFGGL